MLYINYNNLLSTINLPELKFKDLKRYLTYTNNIKLTSIFDSTPGTTGSIRA